MTRSAPRGVSAIVGLTAVLMWAPFAPAQDPAALRIGEADSVREADLRAHGRRLERSRVTVWTPADGMTDARAAALADSIDRGVRHLEAAVGSPLPWQRLGRDRIVYFLHPDPFIAHGTGRGAVFISMHHVERGLAPYLHEAMHEILLPPPPYLPGEYADSVAARRVDDTWPLWLTEGLADFVAHSVAAAHDLDEGDVFEIGGVAGADAACAARIPAVPGLAGYMGAGGFPPELYTTARRRVAPAFYACALSFTAHVVDRIGLDAVVSLIPAADPAARLEELAGTTVDALRAAWLEKLERRAATR